MGWDSPDVYYNPENFGLTTVGSVYWYDGSYEFDMTVVWKDAEGNFYWAHDSGCSCPSPFEDYTSLDMLEKGTAHEAAADLQAALSENRYYNDNKYAAPQVVELISKIMA